ncbi:glycosyltransferase family 39 protein [Nonomuraea sediminis]|uniref:glycosyltransferase family 39 protein n=1 Tax=Nonomuraea sediminis TaxID=2835864 RepID=UPI001BDBD87F|nr:glycosyltransferase family 39 protein [Nonomuraea sediminis]
MKLPFAWRSVTLIAVLLLAVLLVLSAGYGYHRDELYFRVLADHPAWGYVDQPPFTPMVAKLSLALFGDTVTALRIFPALASAVLVVLAALITRELGGTGAAQILSALGTAMAAYPLVAGHILLTLSFDMPLWAAAILFMLRALLRDQPRWWLAAGLAVGVATYNKQLIVMLLIGLLGGLLIAGPRRVLASPWLWAGAAIAAVLTVPNVLYQVTHDWPQLKMAAALSEDKGADFRTFFVPFQFILFGVVAAIIGIFGWLRLWRDRRVRALAVAYPVTAVVTVASGGRYDYTAGLILLLFAAGCVGAAARPRLASVALVVNGLGNAVVALPLIPVAQLAATPVPAINETAREQVGWPSFAATVAGVLHALPPADQAKAAILVGNYGEYGMLDKAGLPRVYSGHNQLYEYGPPPETADVAVVMNVDRGAALAQFDTCELKARVDNGVDVDNEEQGLEVYLCRGHKQPWATAWPRWQHFS